MTVVLEQLRGKSRQYSEWPARAERERKARAVEARRDLEKDITIETKSATSLRGRRGAGPRSYVSQGQGRQNAGGRWLRKGQRKNSIVVI